MTGTSYGRFELIRKIAAGGMAEIFLGRQWGEGGFFRDVVIKRLFQNFVEHEPTLRMFHYEARLLAHLSHPNIPQVFDLGFADGTWFLAMEYVDGWNVADVWRAGSRTKLPMPLHVTIGVVMQVCEALHHAHECRDKADRPLRIIHRDVTPQNVMLTRDGVAKLMDFGVAKTDARPATEAGLVKGTFSYMAPEQVRSRPIDRRADVFSLGVILYELTTGSRLFRGNDMQVMTQVVETDAPSPRTRIPDYPEDLEEIVLAALRRDARGRIGSAADLALHLEHFALRHGLLVGPRAIATYLSQLFPSERVAEHEMGLVPPSDAPHAHADPASTDALLVDDADFEEVDEDAARPLDAPEIADDSLPGFLPISIDETGGRPVVLLDAKKKRSKREDETPVAPADGYLEDLMRRLEEEGEGNT